MLHPQRDSFGSAVFCADHIVVFLRGTLYKESTSTIDDAAIGGNEGLMSNAVEPPMLSKDKSQPSTMPKSHQSLYKIELTR